MFKGVISFIGGGNIARSLIGGLIKTGHPRSNIIVTNRSKPKLEALVKDFGVVAANNVAAVKSADVVVLAVKSQVVPEVSKEVAEIINLKKPLIISLATGMRIDDLKNLFKSKSNIIRSMPNSSALIGKGTTALFANFSTTSHDQKKIAEYIFNASGNSYWLDSEAAIDKITPLVGCGPAYLYLLIEAMQKAAIKQGVKPEIAKAAAIETMLGAATMAQDSGVTAEELRKRVTTPNGATEAAMRPLLEKGFFSLIDSSFAAAEQRCTELGDTLAMSLKANMQQSPKCKL